MTEERTEASFGQYLKPPAENTDKNEEDEKDSQRLEKINELVEAYTEKAKQSEKDYETSKKNAKLGNGKKKNQNLENLGQFASNIPEVIPEDVKELLEQKEKEESAETIDSPNKKKKLQNLPNITIDLFSAQQAELKEKQKQYSRRQASPNARVHERLYANALEKTVKQKITDSNWKKRGQFSPKISQISMEITKSKGRQITNIDVFLH